MLRMCDMIEISKGFTQNCHIYTLIPWATLEFILGVRAWERGYLYNRRAVSACMDAYYV